MKTAIGKLKTKMVFKRAFSIITAFAMLFAALPIEHLAQQVMLYASAEMTVEPRAHSIAFASLEDFVAYSSDYAKGTSEVDGDTVKNYEYYSKDIITLSLNTGSTNEMPNGYIGLGTIDVPFDGKIIINAASDSYQLAVDTPLFTNVSDSVLITKNNGTDVIELDLKRKKADVLDQKVELSPLFARLVTHSGDGGTTWKIRSSTYNESGNVIAYNFSGLIGTLNEQANVNIEFKNDSFVDANNTAHVKVENESEDDGIDAGLIAGRMKNLAKIALKLSGTNTSCNISSSYGSAGGLVGKMDPGAEIVINEMSYTPTDSRTISAYSYAGGIVGYCDGGKITIADNVTVPVKGVVISQDEESAAGGLCGYYSSPAVYDDTTSDEIDYDDYSYDDVSFDISKFDIDVKLKSQVMTGGLFGMLYSSADVSVTGSSIKAANEIDTSAFGGICGKYQTNSLENMLEVSSITLNTSSSAYTDYYGGVAAVIIDNDPAYIKVDDLIHNTKLGCGNGSTGTGCFGGVVADAGSSQGSMLDIASVTVSTMPETGSSATKFHGGGLVGNIQKGVVRLSGVTTMTNAPCEENNSDCGQLVGIRGEALVYAVGSGNSGDTGWEFNRSSVDVRADDIGTWGEVVRVECIETNILSFDGSEHTVTIKKPVNNTNITSSTTAITIPNKDAFIRLALYMQLNSSGDSSSALEFQGATQYYRKNNLFKSAITYTIGQDIDLTDTGITGLMRDDATNGNDKFCAKITASAAKTITLKTGQQYGVISGTSNYRGAICGHKYNGLLARTGAGAEVSNINIAGNICVKGFDVTYIGGVAAEVTDGIKLTDVNVSETIDTATPKVRLGGYIGVVSSANSKEIAISGTKPEIKPTINNGAQLNNESSGDNHSIGGAIGYIASVNSFDVKITNAEVGTTITNSGNASSRMRMAGLIADIAANTSDTRTIYLTNVTVKGTTISNNATGSTGGMLGYNWHNTNVSFSGLTLEKNGSTNNAISTSAPNLGGLVFTATGHWTVPEKGITIRSLKDNRTSGDSFGMLVNRGYATISNKKYGLYLDLTHVNSYVLPNMVGEGGLAASGDITVIASTVYDELVAYSGADGKVLSNKGGVVSITTSGDSPTVLMSGSTCSTYQNKYNKSKTNGNTRYYYNLDYIKDHLTDDNGGESDAKKLLFWSLSEYAAGNISGNFAGGAVCGNCDMEGISYYPIDVSSITIADDLKLKFYNSQIEDMENAESGNTDSNVRSTRSSSSQHYLMHSGLFLNATGTVKTQGNLHFIGNIVSDSTYSGVFIKGTLSGSLLTADNKDIVFEGLTMSSNGGALFINKITGSDQSVQINGVRTGGLGFDVVSKIDETGYAANAAVAGSLIGDVTVTNLSMKFNRIKIDARDSVGAANNGYNTTRSIFTNATLLNKLDADLKTNAEYNFNETEDWSGSTHVADVTYGKELTDSIEYSTNGVSNEKYYYDTRALIYITDADKESGTNFSSGYLPYVRFYHSSVTNAPAPINQLREIKVNVKSTDLTTGCGTYDHPYEINDAVQLVSIAGMIAGGDSIPTIRLPKTVAKYSTNYNSHWCHNNNAETCAEYTTTDGTTYTSTETGAAEWTKAEVREYLASAYYQVISNITISDSKFQGLGSYETSGKGQYAFRGVIAGRKGNENVKIKNKTKSPLINFCTGAVIKDIDVEVEWPSNDTFVSCNINADNTSEYSLSNDDCKAYGAVIGKIFAGDNIIDNVNVTFTEGHHIEITSGALITDNNRKKRNVANTPLGGYIGTVIDGCVIFRNMAETTAESMGMHVDSVVSVYKYSDVQVDSPLKNVANDSSDSNYDNGNGKRFLYVNPIIGRVINGFVINETDTYRYSEDGKYGDGETRVTGGSTVTLKNGRKNYSIADIDSTSETKLQFRSSNFSTTISNNASSMSVFAPDAQSLYIMSGILIIGAGTADTMTGNYNYSTAYSNGSSVGNYNATHHAAYSAIGETDAVEKASVATDTVNSTSAIPYIIEHYTEKVGDNYPARMLTGNKGSKKHSIYLCKPGEQSNDPPENAEDTIYYMPDGFRGLGSFTADNTNRLNKSLYLKCFDGRNKTIDMNAVYKSVAKTMDNYYRAEKTFGPGLFIALRQDGINNNGTSATDDRSRTIGNFALSGYISGESINPADGGYKEMVFVGGVIGNTGNNNTLSLNIGGIKLNNLHLFGTHHTGGIVGYATNNTLDINNGALYINNFEAKGDRGLKVEAWSRAGGLVGTVDRMKVYINTLSDEDSEFKIASVENVGSTSTDGGITQCGGIIGNIWSQNMQVLIKNVHIVKKDDNSCIKCSDANINSSKNGVDSRAGGIVGSVGKCGYLMIVGCSVSDMTIKGNSAGGFVGANYNNNTKPDKNNGYIKIYNGAVNNCNITGKKYAGGLVGYDEEDNQKYTADSAFQDPTDTSDDTKNYYHDIDGCLVADCTIEHTDSDSSSYASGGLVGLYTPSTVRVRTICNSLVTGCTLISPEDTNSSMGGLIGRTSKTKVYGYNLAVNDITFKRGTSVASGDILKRTGNLVGCVSYGEIKLVGVTRQGTLVPEKTSSQNDIDVSLRQNSPSIFVVYGDYDGSSTELFDNAYKWGSTSENSGANAKNFIETKEYAEQYAHLSGLTNDESINDVFAGDPKKTYPFVIDSPYTVMGKTGDDITEVLNGDGAKTYSPEGANKTYPLIKRITEDRSSSKKYVIPDVYSSNDEDDANYARMQKALSQTDDSQNKISTYKNEMGKLPSANIDDFAVVTINSENQEMSTNIVKNYIRAVTNTDIDYSYKEEDEYPYKLNIYACTFKDGKYSIDAEARAGLMHNSDIGRFYMVASGADTNKDNDQFSLIDIEYFDPADSSMENVVMHVYIPVLTKKMLNYGIKTASLSGTDYKYTNDPNYVWGNTLFENMNSWYTAFVSFSYSMEELQSLVDSETGLKWHNDKVISMEYSDTTVAGDKLNGDTQLVLVDPNKNTDEYYYSLLSHLRSNENASTDADSDTLYLSDFKQGLTTGKEFTPIDFRELAMNQNVISVEEYSSGDKTGFNYVLADEDTGTVAYKNGDTILYLKYKTEEEEGQYKVTVTDGVVENYYLSVMVKSKSSTDKFVFNYNITSPLYLDGSVKARRSGYDEKKITHILTGDLYTQQVLLEVKNNGKDEEQIDDTNHQLQLTMVTRISMNGTTDEKTQLLIHLNANSNISVLQSFIIDLTAYDYDNTRTKILSKPDLQAEFAFKKSSDANAAMTTGYSTPVDDDTWGTQVDNDIGGNYIKLNSHDIKEYLDTTMYTYVRAKATITFDDYEEFPKRTGDDQRIGVNVSLSSNLSYSEASIVYSNMTKSPDTPDSKYFYIRDIEKAELTFNAIGDIPDMYDSDGLPEKSNNTSQLGINPKNFFNPSTTRIPIYNTSSYNASKVKHSEFANTKYIEYTLELYQKTDSGGTAHYEKVSDMSRYIDFDKGVNIQSSSLDSDMYSYSGSFDTTDSGKLIFRASIDPEKFTAENQQKFEADIDFTVKTGADCTEHANYRMMLHVDLVDDNYASINSKTKVKDWVVYTNAKINPTMLLISEYPGG